MILDLIIILIVAFGFYIGYQRGLIKTVFDTLSLIIGLLAALKLSPIMIRLIESITNMNPAITFIIGIVLTFIIVMALIRYIGKKLEDVFKATNLNVLNQVAGGAVQGLFFAFLLSMGLWLMGNLKLLDEETKAKSQTYSLLEPLPRMGQDVFQNLRPMFQEFWDKTVETMEDIKKKGEALENGQDDSKE